MIPGQWESLISKERILALHREAINRYGGDPTQRLADVGCVEGRIGSAATAVGYLEAGDEDCGLILAAYLLFYLARDHCFVDGNKRVAWMAATEVFRNLRLTINASSDEAEEFVVDVSRGALRDASAVAIWFAERLEAVESNWEIN